MMMNWRPQNWLRVSVAAGLTLLPAAGAPVQTNTPGWHMEYKKVERASFTEEWNYAFPNYVSKRWFIALRYQPTTAWNRDVQCEAALLTSEGWKPFTLVHEGSRERRLMLVIDYPHNDPLLKSGFKVKTTLTATLYDQRLVSGDPVTPAATLNSDERQSYLVPTTTFDFGRDSVKDWITQHNLWKMKDEAPQDFVRRVYRELRKTLPFSGADGGPWICSQILKAGFGECARHAIVGTSILRANGIPARSISTLWAVDDTSQGAHCWGEFFWEGVGWVPYDTSLDQWNQSDAYFGYRKGLFIGESVDMDWVIYAGSMGWKTAFAIDAWPCYWAEGQGSFEGQKEDHTTSVKIIERYQ
jgi:transglutaminase-like putative cysteine protease